jgi:hypothetical protein
LVLRKQSCTIFLASRFRSVALSFSSASCSGVIKPKLQNVCDHKDKTQEDMRTASKFVIEFEFHDTFHRQVVTEKDGLHFQFSNYS